MAAEGRRGLPRSAALRHRTGRVLLSLKRPDEAAKELEEALALEPRFLDARLALGLAEEARGRREPARAALQEAQKLAPPRRRRRRPRKRWGGWSGAPAKDRRLGLGDGRDVDAGAPPHDLRPHLVGDEARVVVGDVLADHRVLVGRDRIGAGGALPAARPRPSRRLARCPCSCPGARAARRSVGSPTKMRRPHTMKSSPDSFRICTAASASLTRSMFTVTTRFSMAGSMNRLSSRIMPSSSPSSGPSARPPRGPRRGRRPGAEASRPGRLRSHENRARPRLLLR